MTEETTSPLCTKPHCSVKPSLFPSSVNTPFSTKLFKEHSTRVQIYMSTDGNKETKYYPVQATQKCHRSVATTQIFLLAFGYKNVKQINNPSSVRIMLFSVPPSNSLVWVSNPWKATNMSLWLLSELPRFKDVRCVILCKPTRTTDKNLGSRFKLSSKDSQILDCGKFMKNKCLCDQTWTATGMVEVRFCVTP